MCSSLPAGALRALQERDGLPRNACHPPLSRSPRAWRRDGGAARTPPCGRGEAGPRLPLGSKSDANRRQTKVQSLCAGRPRALLHEQNRPRAAPPCDCGAVARQRHPSPSEPSAFLGSEALASRVMGRTGASARTNDLRAGRAVRRWSVVGGPPTVRRTTARSTPARGRRTAPSTLDVPQTSAPFPECPAPMTPRAASPAP